MSMRASSSRRAILDPQPSKPLSPTSWSTSGRPKLVVLESWHLDYFLDDDERDQLEGRALGRVLMASDNTPLGFAGVYFDENGKGEAVAIVFFYGGPNQYFMRKYLTFALRGMIETVRQLIEMGIENAYCVADLRVPGSEKFIQWAGGELIDEHADPNGPIYRLPLKTLKFLR